MDAIAAYGSDDDAAIGVDASSREVQARSGDRHLEHGERSRDGTSAEAPETSAGGRVRSFPHVEGDFATHVRVPVDIPLGVRASLARALADIVARGHEEATVLRVWRMLDLAEYKRRQAPPGVKTTRRAFGRDRRYPITNGFRGQV